MEDKPPSDEVKSWAHAALSDPENLDLALNPKPLVRALLTALEHAEVSAATYRAERDSMWEALEGLQNSLEPDRTRRASIAERERDQALIALEKMEAERDALLSSDDMVRHVADQRNEALAALEKSESEESRMRQVLDQLGWNLDVEKLHSDWQATLAALNAATTRNH